MHSGARRRTYEQLLRDVATERQVCSGAVPPGQTPGLVQQSGVATATVRLNIRQGEPTTRAPVHQVVPRGTELACVGLTNSGEPVNGNPVWYADANGNFFWSGGVSV